MLYAGVRLPGKPDLDNVARLDMLPIPMIRRMQRAGMAIDVPFLRDLSRKLDQEMDDLRLEIACQVPAEKLEEFVRRSDSLEDWNPINVNSSEQIAEILFDTLGLGKGRNLRRTATGDRISTGKKQLETLKNEHPIVQKVLDYRERAKLKTTYVDKLPEIARLHTKGECQVCGLWHWEDHWRVHTEITFTRTDTGRFASKNPNLQNIPARTRLGRAVRQAFVASKGKRIVGRDFSQIELRLLAHCADERHMIKVFQCGEDIHLSTAMRAFGIEDKSKVDKLLHRAPCKTVNFGIVYGLAAPGLYDNMAVTYATAGLPMPDWLTVEWCEKFIRDWFSLYPGVEPYMERQHYRARRYGVVWDIFGRVRRVPEVRSVHYKVQSAGLRQAGNMPIQASAAGLMKISMGELEEELQIVYDKVVPLMTIHDELLFEVDEDWAEAVNVLVGEVMDRAMTDRRTGKNLCRVPIESDGKVTERWMKE